MPMIRHGNHYSIDVFSRHDFAKIVIFFAVLVFVILVDDPDSVREMILVDIASGDRLAILVLQKRLEVIHAHTATPDNAQSDAFGRRRCSPRTGSNVRGGQSGAGKGEEFPPVDGSERLRMF